ncbi:MAG: ATP-binding protein [Pseudomonadota bacterium]
MTSARQTVKYLFSTEGRLVVVALVGCVVALFTYHALMRGTNSVTLAVVVALGAAVLITTLGVSQVFRPQSQRIRALIDSADSLRDADFSFTIAAERDDEVGELVHAYNHMVSTLREERQNLHQRELMLDTVLQASPLALVLCNDAGHVIYANSTARDLFYAGKRFAGLRFIDEVVAHLPPALAEALAAANDAMVTVEGRTQTDRYHLSCSNFTLNARRHRLYLLKRLTHELNRQEVATWKKVIRLIGHELNNSLAPISSMAHSGAVLFGRQQYDKIPGIFTTIEQRSAHLKSFIEGYSRVAKLPAPQFEELIWDAFLEPLANLHGIRYQALDSEASGCADRKQLEQVIINLCKNALESGSAQEDIVLSIAAQGAGWQITLADRGKGMSDESLESALLPFYSTKKSGSGLGLSLCREIMDAHNGRIGLHNRANGGLTVKLWLPGATAQGINDVN